MNNRMPFSKMKERFPSRLFSQLPCLGGGGLCENQTCSRVTSFFESTKPVSKGVGYCEIRGYNDNGNNILKTAEYLSLNKWVRKK